MSKVKNGSEALKRTPSHYNTYRPPPPEHLVAILHRLSRQNSLDMVVDIGCGTGLSARPWATRAKQVIGVDPSDEMIDMARTQTPETNVLFIQECAHATGLKTASADIITAASSMHWMDLEPTAMEIKRILKPYGIFSYYGPYALPLSPFLEIDAQYSEFRNYVDNFIKTQVDYGTKRSDDEISGVLKTAFKISRMFYIHQEIFWTSDDYLGWVLSRGDLLAQINNATQPIFDLYHKLEYAVKKSFGTATYPCVFTYKVNVFK